MKTACVIPSRYGSVRLPGKPLIDICGKPLIQRVYESAISAKCLDDVIVATDDKRIFDAVVSFKGRAAMTPSSLPTGTDRVASVVDELGLNHDVVVNLQGDEPLLDATDLQRLIECFKNSSAIQLASLMAPLNEEADVLDSNHVKVAVDHENFALYFSRYPIPFWRKRESSNWSQHPAKYWLHLGVYAFRRSTLRQFTQWPRSMLEMSESLEQLRALEHGVRIKMVRADNPWPGVNTLEDVERVRAFFKGK